MGKTFIICKHPESNQTMYDAITNVAASPDATVVVYGVQNLTPNPVRVFSKPNVHVITAEDNKLDTDALQAELLTHAPTCIVIVHTINVVDAICAALKGYIEGAPGLSVCLYCEIPRDLPLRKHFEALKAFACAEGIAPRLKVFCSIKQHAALLRLFVGASDVKVLPPGVYAEQYHKLGKAAREALGVKDGEFAVLALGRIDTAVMAFADFVKRHPELNSKLIMPIDQNLKDTTIEMYVNEFAMRDLVPRDHIKKLILLREIGVMSSEEINIIMSACNVLLHANPVTDYNVHVHQGRLVGVPQIVPALPKDTEDLRDPGSLVRLVDTNFHFYIFDEYGGKLSMAGHREVALALLDVFENYASFSEKALAGRDAPAPSWDAWKVAFTPPSSCVPPPVQPPFSKAEAYQSEIDDLKQKLADILLAVRA